MNFGQTNVTPQAHGNVWRVRVRINGEQKPVTLCPLSDTEGMNKVQRKAYLSAKIAQVLADVNAGNNPTAKEIAPEHLTVKTAGDSWLNWCQTRRRNPISTNTVLGYTHLLSKIYPVVGNILLKDFKSMQAKKVIDACHEAGLSSKTVNEVASIMQQLLAHPKDADGQPLYDWKLDRDVMDVPSMEKSETKAFTKEQIEAQLKRLTGQYRVFAALAGGTGARVGELLAIEIDGDLEKVTTFSKDCRVLYVNTIILQDGTKQDNPKTDAGVREIDIHPDVAAEVEKLIGNRTSGYLFCTDSGKAILYANLIKNVFNQMWWDRERPLMKREGKGWKQVGSQKIPGVLGSKEDLQDKERARTGYGFHSFRRFRETHCHLAGVPDRITDFWTGHGPETMGEIYTKIKSETAKRREWCEKAGLGFALEPVNEKTATGILLAKGNKVVKIKTAGKTANKKGKAA